MFKKIFNSKFDSCFAAYSQHKNYWLFKEKGGLVRLSNLVIEKNLDRLKPILREDTGVALATKSYCLRKGERIGKNVTCVVYDNPKYNIDINKLEDLKLAKKFLINNKPNFDKVLNYHEK